MYEILKHSKIKQLWAIFVHRLFVEKKISTQKLNTQKFSDVKHSQSSLYGQQWVRSEEVEEQLRIVLPCIAPEKFGDVFP